MFNLSKIFRKEIVPKLERNETNEEFFEPVVVTEKKAFDPEVLTLNFTPEEVEKYKNKGMNDKEIELLKKTAINNLKRARFDNSN